MDSPAARAGVLIVRLLVPAMVAAVVPAVAPATLLSARRAPAGRVTAPTAGVSISAANAVRF
ncbi:hypothetical protein VBJFXLJN_CDS_0009 [Pseudomonas phage TIVP-H6]